MSDEILFYPNTCNYTHKEEIILALLRKCSSSISVLSAFYTLALIAKKWRHDTKSNTKSIDPYQRIMVGLSISDILELFFFWFLGTWMIPSETGWWGAVGTTQTCSAQGFFTVFGWVGSSVYQMSLSLNMLLLISFGWTERKFQQKLEKYIHPIILASALIIATIPLFFEGYNPSCLGGCNFHTIPRWCSSWMFGSEMPDVECKRGSPSFTQGYLMFWLSSTLFTTAFCTWAMIMVYFSVRKQERRTNKYRYDKESHNRESKRIRGTLVLYTLNFYVCWVFGPVVWFVPQLQTNFVLRCMSMVLFPLKSFFNLLVFLRPKVLKYKKDTGTSLLISYFHVIFGCRAQCVCSAISRLSGKKSTSSESDDDGIGFASYNESTNAGGTVLDETIQNQSEEGRRSSVLVREELARQSSVPV